MRVSGQNLCCGVAAPQLASVARALGRTERRQVFRGAERQHNSVDIDRKSLRVLASACEPVL